MQACVATFPDDKPLSQHKPTMTDAKLVDNIANLFAPYLNSREQTRQIRRNIARNIDALTIARDGVAEPPPIPQHIQGVRRRYIEALDANRIAKTKLSHLQASKRPIPDVPLDSTSNLTSASVLASHLEALKLREQHQQYQTISHYATKAEEVAKINHLHNLETPREAITDSAHNHSDDELQSLVQKANELTRQLENALIRANFHLKREKKLLGEVQSQPLDRNASRPSDQLHALSAARQELTNWVESSLLKCDSEIDIPDQQPPEFDSAQVSNEIDRVEEEYRKYVQARSELLAAASNVMTPLPQASLTDLPQMGKTVEPGQARSKSTILPHLTAQHIPAHSHRIAIDQHDKQARNISSKANQDLAEELIRLSHESHLLPSFPILVKAKGKHGDEFNGTQPSAHVDRIEELLQAWEFAANAAGNSSSGTVEKWCRESGATLDEVTEIVKLHQDFKAMWTTMGLETPPK